MNTLRDNEVYFFLEAITSCVNRSLAPFFITQTLPRCLPVLCFSRLFSCVLLIAHSNRLSFTLSPFPSHSYLLLTLSSLFLCWLLFLFTSLPALLLLPPKSRSRPPSFFFCCLTVLVPLIHFHSEQSALVICILLLSSHAPNAGRTTTHP